MNLTADKAKAFAILGASIVAGFIIFKVYKGGKAVADATKELITEDLNPASDQNLAYRAVNAIVPGEDQTLGTWLYDLFNPAPDPKKVYRDALYKDEETAAMFRSQDDAFLGIGGKTDPKTGVRSFY